MTSSVTNEVGLGTRLAKSASLTIAVLSAIAIFALTGVVVGAASRIDQDARRHAEALVANGLAIKVASVSNRGSASRQNSRVSGAKRCSSSA